MLFKAFFFIHKGEFHTVSKFQFGANNVSFGITTHPFFSKYTKNTLIVYISMMFIIKIDRHKVHEHREKNIFLIRQNKICPIR